MKKLSGFSLIELLISLMIISLIISIFAPIMTKKLRKTDISVENGNIKRGLEIYSNPGVYSFDVPIGITKLYFSGSAGGGGGAGATSVHKTKSITGNETFTIPMGVNAVTFTITGSGGGGGAANGSQNGVISNTNYVNQLNNNSCYTDGSSTTAMVTDALLMRGSEDETDLCMNKYNVNPKLWTYEVGSHYLKECMSSTSTNVDDTTKCLGNSSTYWPNGIVNITTEYQCPSGRTCNTKRPLVNYAVAANMCNSYNVKDVTAGTGGYRLPTENEIRKIWDNVHRNAWARDELDFCAGGYGGTDKAVLAEGFTVCHNNGYCLGGRDGVSCDTAGVCIQGSKNMQPNFNKNTNKFSSVYASTYSGNSPSSVRCARSLNRFNRYSGAGGASGAQLTKTIQVLPNDTLTVSIGKGGVGGVSNQSKTNGVSSRNGNGEQGKETKIVHKRNGSTIGEYYVKGGFGGFGAKTNAHGEAINSSQLTPNGTCYANGNTNCTIQSFSGTLGAVAKGGNGGRVNNTGNITDGNSSSGGILSIDNSRTINQRYTASELNKAKGQNASVNGFGGGGGFMAPWVCDNSNCIQTAPVTLFTGGQGANGKVDLSYDIILPGGGGGAGSSIGLDKDNINHEIEYTVIPGDRIVVSIGQGGIGGDNNQAGNNGSDTSIMEDEIIFKGGMGGLLGNTSTLQGGLGGQGGSLVIKSSVQSKVRILNSDNISNIGTGKNGEQGQLKTNTNTYLSYGFDGGMGGVTFLGYFGACGGGVVQDNNTQRNCVNANRDGKDAQDHNAVSNQYGGSGGGGGGVAVTSTTLGAGGRGSNGYLRVRWGE